MIIGNLVEINGPEIRVDSLAQAAFILILAIMIVLTNLILVSSYLNYQGPMDVITYCYLSLSVADLICGLGVIPLSVYPALIGHWIYGDYVCRAMGYLGITLWSISMHTVMWMAVDRYLAVKKPLKYEALQTTTRVQCWMGFTWICSAMLFLPPFLGYENPIYDKNAYICMLDFGNMAAYGATLAVFVLGPSLITIVYNYVYMIGAIRKFRAGLIDEDKEFLAALAESLESPNHLLSGIIVFMFLVCWTPFIALRLYELVIIGERVDVPYLHFGLIWLGISNSFWKFIVMLVFSPNFRLALKIFCLTLCCKAQGRLQYEMVGLDED